MQVDFGHPTPPPGNAAFTPPLCAQNHAHPTPPLLQASYYSDVPRSSATPSAPSSTAGASPGRPKQSVSSPKPSVATATAPGATAMPPPAGGDGAPPRDVSADTIDAAYVAFILHCNPSFAPTTDTAELVRSFRAPPRSDGNAFSTWHLFELIRRLDAKDIKTWTQLALELGVERPDVDKGQSTQKVQQYSVRLKRWMRAMHIDAFFEYLLGKPHSYYAHIPPAHDPFPENGRDGVQLEEDLAVRALDPKLRPKRGRRKADDMDDHVDTNSDASPPRKRPSLDTAMAFGSTLPPPSAYPSSTHPDDVERFLAGQDQWHVASALTPASAMPTASAPGRFPPSRGLTPLAGQLRWRLHPHDAGAHSYNPITPHPISAVTPTQGSAHPDAFADEPQSAVTPGSGTAKPRSRRRHGPAVSSAWPSNSNSSTGKLRGRPPSNRSVRDGPFVTFPANPKTKEGPPIDVNRTSAAVGATLTPVVERAHSDPPPAPEGLPPHGFRLPPTPASAAPPMSSPHGGPAQQRPSRLSLQVPQHVGGPVRLMTPTVLVNGEQDGPGGVAGAESAVDQSALYYAYHHQQPLSPRTQPPALPASVPREALHRALATELIRAPLSGRRKRLRGSEAKNLAGAILRPLYRTGGSTSDDAILSIAVTSCLGLGAQVGLDGTDGAGAGPRGSVKRVECFRYRVGRDGYESPVDEDDGADVPERSRGDGDGLVRETFDVYLSVAFGGLFGEWTAKGLSAGAGDAGAEGSRGGSNEDGVTEEKAAEDAFDWRSKFLIAQRRLRESEEEARQLKERILDAVL